MHIYIYIDAVCMRAVSSEFSHGLIFSFDQFSLVLGSLIRSYVIIYQYRILVSDYFNYEKVNFQIVYIFIYIRNGKIDPFKIDCINALQVFNPLSHSFY